MLSYFKQSDCVQKEHRQAIDCLHSRANTVPSRCFELLETFAQCKLSMIDNRLRARGKKVDLPEVETTEK
ncbi:unnamed protein product [Thelazia callipaeda]|uniref:Cytochrome c oxidase assembly factor 5 n=1 Tax=Thelazia callipaeda TaxID=103827 RepID=A0A0N5D769_THECL|nr:unnamed protein product [Thelazia callipaeda]